MFQRLIQNTKTELITYNFNKLGCRNLSNWTMHLYQGFQGTSKTTGYIVTTYRYVNFVKGNAKVTHFEQKFLTNIHDEVENTAHKTMMVLNCLSQFLVSGIKRLGLLLYKFNYKQFKFVY